MGLTFADIALERLLRRSVSKNTVKMSQDIVADGLNGIMNARKARKSSVRLRRYSKFLISILEIAKQEGFVKDYSTMGKELVIDFKLNKCNAIKPRFRVKSSEIEKYVKRYLPARDFGIIVISTSKGLMKHSDATDQGLGGFLIAYFF